MIWGIVSNSPQTIIVMLYCLQKIKLNLVHNHLQTIFSINSFIYYLFEKESVKIDIYILRENEVK